MISFYEFAKEYVKIKDGSAERPFSEDQLREIEVIYKMREAGYEMKLVVLRKGNKIVWHKNGQIVEPKDVIILWN